ncbi:hypothetical protein Nocox_14405 [Nonomuraea coxensis DSM 45129]|uniref:Asl1-like glycosyl hydrolase catalytic domain-containing protein n=1 Tax=Nonomuraea coxensis DSM 45129 TaxID=1122611 RepID=A0ABX8U1F6_9ACTN|nr:hypothetical protein [Nonomuraea coxensis]QYC40497.1 hypothetical protein Nocox_14405 [Nonomuraea coxensis DSM 45129]
MKKGINYDTGFLPGDDLSRKAFDPDQVAREMRVIAGDLHCDLVRVYGRDPARIAVAAERAAAAGLEVWFSPAPVDLGPDETIALLADAAERAESVRRTGAAVVLVAGCEMSAFGHGFIEGDGYRDRLRAMMTGDIAWWMELMQVMPRFNAYLARVAETVRPLFGGPLTYASGAWEPVDWAPFDLVGVNAYRAAHNAHDYVDELRAHLKHGKPVAVTEFGTCPYAGAGDRGGSAWVVPEGAVRDEGEQVRYFHELMDVFEREGVDAAVWFTYAAYNRTGAADLGSYGVVRMLGDTRWEPKEIFHAMAARYARS